MSFSGIEVPGTIPQTPFPVPAKSVRNVAVLGFGTVGQAVAGILAKTQPAGLRITHVFNRNVVRKQVDWLHDDVCWTEKFEDVLKPEVDIVLELVGGIELPRKWITQALQSGKSVVTANKQLIAQFGPELASIARQHGVQLVYGASVCGGIPVLSAIEHGLTGERITGISAILNGTCNYILTRMEAGDSFDSALRDAQKLGYAEADPTDDVDGFDARAKLVILARAALGCEIQQVATLTRSIRPLLPIDFVYAHSMGCTIRQVSRAQRTSNGVVAMVQPFLVPLTSPMAKIEGSRNVVSVSGEFGGETVLSGSGAGGNPTAVAVVSDLLGLLQSRSAQNAAANDPERLEVITDFEAPHFIRFVINDEPGILAALATAFSRKGINIDEVLQERNLPKSELPFVITLEKCLSSQVSAALEEINRFGSLVVPALALPILTE